MMVERIKITNEAVKIIEQLHNRHGELMFHQSGGCCDGSSPMCLEKGELMLNETDIWLGTVSGCEFYMSQDQFAYWQHTQLTIDVTSGRGASFSLEIPLGVRFVIKSRMFTEKERLSLTPTKTGAEII